MTGGRKSVNAALLDQMMGTDEASQRKKARKRGEKENIKRELEDYDKYEKELKKRKGKKRSFSDREIDPRKIADTRKKAEKLGLYKPKKKIRFFKPKKPVTGMLESQGY
ncbi:MAG TPA: hypothetical protein EYM55_05630 [Candidatus Marinimicrobia bacterium]|nr:hypothetical protein [Candidatus Neomarinimicrobiota bacterium]